MTIAAFHEKAAALGWACSPTSGTNKYGWVTVGPNLFDFEDGKLYSASIEDQTFSTEKGMRVGDTIDTMMRLYGEPDAKSTLPDNGGVEYSYSLSAQFGIGVVIKAGKVAAIVFGG